MSESVDHSMPNSHAGIGCRSCHRLWQEVLELRRRIAELESEKPETLTREEVQNECQVDG